MKEQRKEHTLKATASTITARQLLGKWNIVPLVLVQNERTVGGQYDHWKDVAGERYHFPNVYKNKIVTGTPFVYYRGTRLAGGSRRSCPEYFGCGRIGEVWRDSDISPESPKRSWRWFCTIEDYLPFSKPVPWKQNGTLFENIPKNAFRNGVRELSPETFESILGAAGLTPQILKEDQVDPPGTPPMTQVSPSISETSLLAPTPTPSTDSTKTSSTTTSASRRSKFSKAIGDHAEEVVLSFLRGELPPSAEESLRWVAKQGEKPGWDIQYNDGGCLVGVEVKGTSGPLFSNVELTAREWKAAESLGDRYWLYLVANCLTKHPVIERIQNPFALMKAGALRATPATWRLELPLAHDNGYAG